MAVANMGYVFVTSVGQVRIVVKEILFMENLIAKEMLYVTLVMQDQHVKQKVVFKIVTLEGIAIHRVSANVTQDFKENIVNSILVRNNVARGDIVQDKEIVFVKKDLKEITVKKNTSSLEKLKMVFQSVILDGLVLYVMNKHVYLIVISKENVIMVLVIVTLVILVKYVTLKLVLMVAVVMEVVIIKDNAFVKKVMFMEQSKIALNVTFSKEFYH